MKLTSFVIGFALLLTSQFAAASTSATATHHSIKISNASEGPGPDVPPIIINRPKPPALGVAMNASEGPGPDVPPIIINKPKPPAAGGFNEGGHRKGDPTSPLLRA